MCSKGRVRAEEMTTAMVSSGTVGSNGIWNWGKRKKVEEGSSSSGSGSGGGRSQRERDMVRLRPVEFIFQNVILTDGLGGK
jgi:hypothetical protein